MTLDPSLRGLNDCGCCEGVTAQTPALISNRPGLPAIGYRIGTHRTFLRTMLSSLSATPNPVLRRLQTREGDDFSVALLDAWATTADVLTFYSERIANESYLRTATERLSILHLARLIGYELGPGVAASTHAAFNLETAPGAPDRVTLEPGVRLQSVPGPGETAQIFETVETITARPEWNAMRPQLTFSYTPTTGLTTLYLKGVDLNLKPGDHLLVAGSSTSWVLRRITGVTLENEEDRTTVTVEAEPGSLSSAPSGLSAGVWALRVRVSPFGHNAPLKMDPVDPADLDKAEEWDLDEFLGVLDLDSVQDAVSTNSWVVVSREEYFLIPIFIGMGLSAGGGIGAGGGTAVGISHSFSTPKINLLLKAQEVQTRSRAGYGITGRVTQIRLSGNWLDPIVGSLSQVRGATVYAGSEPLPLAEAPMPNLLGFNSIQVAGDLSLLPIGRTVAVTGRLMGQAAHAPLTRELVTLDGVSFSGGYTTLHFKKSLTHQFDRRTVTLNANVALATQGETVSEVLGGGDPAVPYQAFKLKQAPLTYTSGSQGLVSSLAVRVNDALWQQTPTLFDRLPGEHVYVSRAGNDGSITVRFGDGENGARLPRGADNVRATYRKGAGVAGNVKAGQLSLLLTRPLGVKDVINPTPAQGGADPEAQEQARENAPIAVLTLGRVVSLRDYEDYARAFPGIAKALATWTWDGKRRGVLLTVAGADGAAIPEDSPTYSSLLGALTDAGDPHVSIRLRSYAPVKFVLTGSVTRAPEYLAETVDAAVHAALLDAFSFARRRLGQAVALSEVVAAIQAVRGVLGVDVDTLYRPGQTVAPHPRLPAFAPQGGTSGGPGAELLTIDEAAAAAIASAPPAAA